MKNRTIKNWKFVFLVLFIPSLFLKASFLAANSSLQQIEGFTKANQLVDSGEYEQAIVLLNHLINQNPKDVEAFFLRGNAFYQLREFDRAMVDFRKTVQIDPKFAMGHQSMGMVYYREGKLNDSIVSFDRAITFDPELGIAYYNRGISFLHKQRYDLSLSDFLKASKLGVEVDAHLLKQLNYDEKETPQGDLPIKA